jgi:Tol biopolymer transport system component
MKRCPECLRDYSDETLSFCLDDGTALVDGPAVDAAKTVAFPNTELLDEGATKIHRSHSGDVDGPRSASSAEYLIGEIRRHKVGMLLGSVVSLLVVFGIGYGIYRLAQNSGSNAQPSEKSSNLKMQPLTASGNVWEAAISPDGKFLAYTQSVNGQAGVWTKQISTNSNVQIVEPTRLDYFGLQFTPDGQYVYYGVYETSGGVIYRVPTLGGSPVKIAEDVDGQISFSPDGTQLVFERYGLNDAKSSLVIVNADGTNERTIATRTGHEFFVGGSVAWSPDGKLIACGSGDDNLEHPFILTTVDVADGTLREIGSHRFDSINYINWLKDQSGFVFVGSEKGNNVPRQIWRMSYPAGEARVVTHDLTGYRYLSLTADAKSLVAIQREAFASVWFSPNGRVEKLEQISKAKHEGSWGMTLAPDGRVVYVSNASGATEVWTMSEDGSGAKQLTNDGISKYTPTVTGDGRYIVFVSEKNGPHLWRISFDGGQQVQLTTGSGEGNPRTSPDGNWVVYDSFRTGKQQLWRVSINGGEPQQVSEIVATEPDVSPDGKFIACFFIDEAKGKVWRLGVIPFAGGEPVKSFDVPQTVSVDSSPQWTPDGRGITFVDAPADRSNLWLQPIDGGPPKQLTDFKQGYVFRREWTRDGKKLALVRGSETSDAVLITDF